MGFDGWRCKGSISAVRQCDVAIRRCNAAFRKTRVEGTDGWVRGLPRLRRLGDQAVIDRIDGQVGVGLHVHLFHDPPAIRAHGLV